MFFMKPEIISWNVRGLNDNEKRMGIRVLLGEWKDDSVFAGDKNEG